MNSYEEQELLKPVLFLRKNFFQCRKSDIENLQFEMIYVIIRLPSKKNAPFLLGKRGTYE